MTENVHLKDNNAVPEVPLNSAYNTNRITPRIGTLFINTSKNVASSELLNNESKLDNNSCSISTIDAANNAGLKKYKEYMKRYSEIPSTSLNETKEVGLLCDDQIQQTTLVTAGTPTCTNSHAFHTSDKNNLLETRFNFSYEMSINKSEEKNSAFFEGHSVTNIKTDSALDKGNDLKRDQITDIDNATAHHSDDQESIRIPSPSSVSSVNSISVRPLEWDSGADVGYNHEFPQNSEDNSKLSTIERIALARGSAALLFKSETVENDFKKIALKTALHEKMYRKNGPLGTPNAESTVFGSNIVSTSDSCIFENEGIISPIGTFNSKLFNIQRPLIENDKLKNFYSEKSFDSSPKNKKEYADFYKNAAVSSVNEDSSVNENRFSKEQILKTNKNVHSESSNLKNHIVYKKVESFDLRKQDKQLSSSMELLTIKPDLDNINIKFNTLPRSQKGNNFVNSCKSNLNSLPKNSYILRSINPTKSTSSSSIATVVQRKKELPKVISKLVQTSFSHKSIGTQVTGIESVDIECYKNDTYAKGSHYSNNCNEKVVINEINSPAKQFVSGHTHNGVPCSGARKKKSNFDLHSRESDTGLKHNYPVKNTFQSNVEENIYKLHSSIERNNTLESIESSVRSAKNVWTDHVESIASEDRVNSFEYLPGHFFENAPNENNSNCASSSSGLTNRNQSSRNECFDDGTDKLWDSSTSSTLMKDIERGVNIMSELFRSSNACNDNLKQKLLKKVVEKLIKTEYSDDKAWMESLVKVKSLSEQCSSDRTNGSLSNGHESRRSLIRDTQVDCSIKSSSEKSHSNKTESNSFLVKDKVNTVDKCIGTDKSFVKGADIRNGTRSFNTNTESDGSSIKPKSSADESSKSRNESKLSEVLKMYVGHISDQDKTSNISSSVSYSNRSDAGDWRKPVTKSEKIYEEKLKKRKGKLLLEEEHNRKTSAVILEYLNIERENQLFWIQSEIEHLSNLKRLLEKQDKLKKSLDNVKKRSKNRSILTAVNAPHFSLEARSSAEMRPKNIRKYQRTKENVNSTLTKDPIESSSHHQYEYDTSSFGNMDKRSDDHQNRLHSEFERNVCKTTSKQQIANKTKSSLSNICESSQDDEPQVTMKRTVATETIENVGVQTSKSVNQLPLIKPEWYKKHKKWMNESSCKCKNMGLCKACKMQMDENERKKPISYIITFPQRVKEKNQSMNKVTKGVQISQSENKIKATKVFKKSNNNFHSKTHSSDSCQFSDEKENSEPDFEMDNGYQPLTLKEYLEKNRSDYIARADQRRKCVAEIAYLRELRDKNRKHRITMAPESSDYSQSSTPSDIPTDTLVPKRVFSQKTMRRLTEKKYRQLAEVKNRQLDMKKKESYRTNRLMAEVYKKKLQRKTLKGEVNLSNSISVISSL